MKRERVTPVLAALVVLIVSAQDGYAQSAGARHRGQASVGHSQARFVAPYSARSAYWATPVAYRTAAYYAPSYGSYYGSSYASSGGPVHRQPPVYFVPPLDPNAPLFSFDGSPAVVPDWGWQRVNLAQLAAEVRAKREAGAKP
jgi:hypothetical protein